MQTELKNGNFWHKIEKLVTACRLNIDRLKGSLHPRYPSFVYPFDYGYLENTQAGDGAGIDVWVGSLQGKGVTAIICAVDLDNRDLEIKILLGCTAKEARKILDIHNSGSQAGILVTRMHRQS